MQMNDDRNDTVIWLNGSFVPVSEASISPFDRGFLFGDGLFETLRAQDDRILHHEEHLARLNRSAEALRIMVDPAIDFRETSLELLRMNALERDVCRVKWIISRGDLTGSGLPICERPTVMVTAEKYDPPGLDRYASGEKVTVLPDEIPSSTATHKSLAYLFYLACRQKALDAGFDDCIICDSDGNVAETSIASLLLFDGRKWIVPDSLFSLPGVTVSIVRRLMNQSGMTTVSEPVHVDDLKKMKAVWMLNSMVGIMPVCRIDKVPVRDLQSDLAGNLRNALFEG